MRVLRRRCYRCRRSLPAEHTTVVLDASHIVELCDGCACLYTSGRITIAGVRCPDAETG